MIRIICIDDVKFSDLINCKCFTVLRDDITKDFLINLKDYNSNTIKITNIKKKFEEIDKNEHFYILKENITI